MHIPRTAGTALRLALQEEFPGRRLLVAGAREMASAYERDERALHELRRRARDAQAVLCHFSHGFAELLGIRMRYLSFVRDPVQRVVSHYKHLISHLQSPVYGIPLGALSLQDMLCKQLIPSNLMTRKFAGIRPEGTDWQSIAQGGRGHGAVFIGFGLPHEVWTGQASHADDLREHDANNDTALLQSAMQNLQSDFLFVGLTEKLTEQLAFLQQQLGWQAPPQAPRINSSEGLYGEQLDSDTLQMIRRYNQLDMQLYEFIRSQPDGRFLNIGLL